MFVEIVPPGGVLMAVGERQGYRRNGRRRCSERAGQLQDLLGASASDLIGLGLVHPDPAILAEVVLLYAARIDRVGELDHGTGIRRVRRVAFAEAEQMVVTGRVTDAVTIASLFRARQAGLGEEGPAV
ncbi:hypothetical protein ACWDFL_37170 [Streptomyces bungoensis]